jgi:ABC-type transport system substrate-binding protein
VGSNPISRSLFDPMMQDHHKGLILQNVLALLGLLAVLQGCDKPVLNASAITIPLKYRAEVLDPLQAVDESTVLVVNFLHRRLFAYAPDGKLITDIAERALLRERSVLVTLKPGDATADDVVYALNRVQKDANQSWVMEQMQSVRKVNARTVEIQLANSGRAAKVEWELARIKLTLPQCAIFRAERHRQAGEFVPFSRYRVAEQTGDRILLSANDGTPSVEFIAMPDETARYFAFREGRLDAYEALGIHRRLAHGNDLYEPRTMYDLVVLYAAFNVGPNSALADPALRRAINLAFDRKRLCENTLLGACSGADYPVPAILSPPPPEPFPAAGNYRIPDKPETVTLFTLSDKERLLIAEYMRSVFKQFNIHLEFRIIDLPSMVRESNKGTRGIYLMKWSADYPHAENFLMPLFHSRNAGIGGNRAHIKDAVLDRMLDTSSYTVSETQKLQQRIRYLSPWLFIGFQNMQFFRLKTSRLQIPTIFAGWGERTIR